MIAAVRRAMRGRVRWCRNTSCRCHAVCVPVHLYSNQPAVTDRHFSRAYDDASPLTFSDFPAASPARYFRLFASSTLSQDVTCLPDDASRFLLIDMPLIYHALRAHCRAAHGCLRRQHAREMKELEENYIYGA